jgi:hypothetical protein
VLKTAPGPLPIMDLVAAIQQDGIAQDRPPAKVRASLVSTLLRRRDLFSNPSRGLYGLKEWEMPEGE